MAEKEWRTMARARGAHLRAFREGRGLTQAQLANAASTSQQTIDRLERGAIRDSQALKVVAAILGYSDDSTRETDEEQKARLARTAVYDENARVLIEEFEQKQKVFGEHLDKVQMMPIFSQGANMPGYISQEPIRSIQRPHILHNTLGAYGIIYGDTDMYPLATPGDIILLDPSIPPRPGNEVLYRAPDGRAKLRTLIEAGPTSHRVRKWTDQHDYDLSIQDWPTRHTVVGKYNRT